MSFLWPPMLLFLLAIPLGVAAAVAIDRRRRRLVTQDGLALVGTAGAVGRAPLRARIAAAYTLLGLALLVIGLARPQGVLGLPRVEGTVILAFDVSGSMAATDLTPDRMTTAKAAARTFVERQPDTIRLGVVAFSDAGLSTQVPTDDRAAVLAAIDRLGPERGTSIGRGILASLDAISTALEGDPPVDYYSNRSPLPTPDPTAIPEGTYLPAAIVVFSDGENTEAPDPIEAAQDAADRGVRVHTVGIGTAAGITLEVEGFLVHSGLDESLLRGIADLTDATYFAGDDPEALGAIYDDVGTALVVRSEAIELTSFFAGAGVIVLLVGLLASLLWLGRTP